MTLLFCHTQIILHNHNPSLLICYHCQDYILIHHNFYGSNIEGLFCVFVLSTYTLHIHVCTYAHTINFQYVIWYSAKPTRHLYVTARLLVNQD